MTPSALTITRLRELGTLGDLIGWQARRRFQPAAEVEEGDQGRDLPYLPFVPPGVSKRFGIVRIHEAGRLRQFAGVAEQRPSLCIQLVLGPGRRELMAEMLIAREAANCRRVEAESGSAADLAVDDRGKHLALEAGER